MGFFRQEYWSGLPFLSPGDLPRPWDGTCISTVFCIAGRFFTCWAISSPPNSSNLINIPSFFSLMVSPSSSPVLTLKFLSQLQLCYLLTLLFYQVYCIFSCCSDSTGSSQPRDWTPVSCIIDRFFTIWATREALNHSMSPQSGLSNYSQFTSPGNAHLITSSPDLPNWELLQASDELPCICYKK